MTGADHTEPTCSELPKNVYEVSCNITSMFWHARAPFANGSSTDDEHVCL